MLDTMTAPLVTNAQVAVLGSILLDPKLCGEIMHRVKAEDFRDSSLQNIFLAIRELWLNQQPIDPVTVSAKLGGKHDHLLADILRATPTAANWEPYADILVEEAKLAKLQELGMSLVSSRSLEESRELLTNAQGLLVKQRDRKATSIQDALQEFFDRLSGEPPEYYRWGFEMLDELVQCEKGDFVIIGGYPSAGKTMLSIQFALEFAKTNRVGYFTCETNKKKLTNRIVSYIAQVPLKKIKSHKLSEEDWAKCVDAAEKYHNISLDEVPASGMSVADVQAYALSHRYDVVFIDYLQLLKAEGRHNAYEEVTHISKALHNMAQSCGITVIALSQLTRPDKTQKKPAPPSMSSLRESGQLEQDADIILLLYLEDMNNYRGRRVLKIGKNKEGEGDSMLLDFFGAVQTLSPAKPTKSEQYANAQRACKQAQREHAKRAAVPGQGTFTELPPGEGGELPF